MRMFVAALVGALFGLGLMLSGMTDTDRVQGWLDIFGAWDPTLAFVLGGAILPMALAWRLTHRVATPVLGTAFPPPPDPRLGRNLIIGSTLFGAGWGLAGLCPGPALASLAWGGWGGALFLLAMAAGMVMTPFLRHRFAILA
ncbi:hypothetical protein E2K80_04285 [Rhodophyticola sp. CCM32]|uniref:DUF6691 family protein n=1 Tax=Rhodophyticola sp. CCM32 TaxID=2916397 RepID=UPI00107FA213|nr:DUF6691 family protein [Rhodophyticola sp. CCM32]QBY00054.1 hypothetical protein E2K80_04285 [Rhodophyticola sp. CCM32]